MAQWYKMENFPCPAEGCTSDERYSWFCGQDGNPIYISQTGYLCCESGRHYSQISTWAFDCGNHGFTSNYLPVDGLRFNYGASMALQLLDRAGSEWLAMLVMELGRQFGL